ncbi:ribokinase [Companilactobacillus alimentarius]|uniref:Ribokinase n=1 Tax=Companilactobacillus alimentarius DSM 20249 TaxID=1423720 RepID=A0A2K9HGS8_9LACO|nr:ribokinase [Companilactobacillus alimentarius]AUI71740.1 ribokinase [Companilactobacillus alimentarius DSM 20249]KRK76553.1 ribokinase [Companilactobacillus alimentarius DSM 20249]MDT6953261.1 ribokinase [Companilactobacillus alimentarius]GEO45542.1 ribokinase [Companilactobacillus alimentarius]
MEKVVVLGSINVDTILNIKRLPVPGETMAMSDESNAGGGKGANQAIAAVRGGAKTTFIAKIGQDHAADFMLDTFKKDGLNMENITVDPKAGTGKAYILLDDNGQNSILIYGGANQTISVDDVKNAESSIAEADCLISEFETPIEATLEAFRIAKKNNVVTILNPAPAKTDIPEELFQLTDIIVPNETEAEAITGVKAVDKKSIINSADKLNKMGVKRVIITIGSRGSLYYTDGKDDFVNAYKVSAVDTTAAGDTFIGYLAAKLDSNLDNMVEAMKFASKASSIAVQVKGAQNSIPYVDDVKI